MIDEFGLSGAIKDRMKKNLEARLAERDERGTSRTWGTAFTSKRVKAACTIALSAVLVTAVAVPVGIHYGSSVDRSVSGGGRIPSTGADSDMAPSPYWCAFRFDTDVWEMNKVEATFYCDVDTTFYGWYFDLRKGKITSIDIYTHVANYEVMKESVEARGWHIARNLEEINYAIADIPKGTISDGIYLFDRFCYDNSKDFFKDFGYIEWQDSENIELLYLPEELRDIYANPNQNTWPQGYTAQIQIPQELIVGDSGSLIFNMICFVTFEDGTVEVQDASKWGRYHLGFGWPQVSYSVQGSQVKFYN